MRLALSRVDLRPSGTWLPTAEAAIRLSELERQLRGHARN
jgi:hypothetical protein